MTSVTDSVVALSHGSPEVGVHSPPVRRTRVRARITTTQRDSKTRSVTWREWLRSASEVVYLDAADSWIVSESTPSIRRVWATDYSTCVPADYQPFIVWCRIWRYPAVVFAAVFDSVKWMLIHPLRGPLFIACIGGTVAAIAFT